jgi:AAA domain-containing protein
MGRWDNDNVLRALEAQAEPIGTLVSAFPGEAAAIADQHWIDTWFTDQAKRFAAGTPPLVPMIVVSRADASVLDPLAKRPATSTVKLLSLEPNYFRGFRASAGPISFGESLVVVEGLNSSGKTSISEAVEWLLTGGLSRRSSGHPKELANCIANEFRPESESTWVACTLEVNGTPTLLRRVLVEDYTDIADSTARSTLYRDGAQLTEVECRDLLGHLFAGVHPILMQHTLRDFVYSTPSERRRYFERLLQIDQLTSLIERAVVGNQGLKEFTSLSLGATRKYLDALASACRAPHSIKALREIDRSGEQAHSTLPAKLAAIAKEEFGVAGDIGSIHRTLEKQQREARERQFPGLQALRLPADIEALDANSVALAATELQEQIKRYNLAVEASAAITAADRIMSRAADELIGLGLIVTQSSDDQVCPFCVDPRHTLQPSRFEVLRQYGPITAALQSATTDLNAAERRWQGELNALVRRIRAIAPQGMSVPGAASETLAETTRPLARAALESANILRTATADCAERIAGVHPRDMGAEEYRKLVEDEFGCLNGPADNHKQKLIALEGHLGVGAARDPAYACKEAWLRLVEHAPESADQIAWDAALKKAQSLLETIRKGLIELRSEIIEGARVSFSKAMAEVWNDLRADAGGKFSEISIPPARGKGYKLEFGVKAVLSDGTGDTEVDALRVFSESQVNVVGIAAYVTRAAALGHTLIVLDDPVQSMDEEHFKSLAGKLIPKLIDQGCQVVVLTHSDSFARDLSHANYDRLSYATLRTRFSKRQGCCVDDGSRRVSERLKIAEKLAEEGQLAEAWTRIRLAIERLYTVAMKAADSKFNPDSWRNAAAEDMWDKGAGAVISKGVPGSPAKLKQILAASAKGAHDASVSSVTEIMEAAKYLRTLLGPLRVGAG